MNKLNIFLIALLFSLGANSMTAQSLSILKDFVAVPNSSVLALYKNQFGKWEKPDLDDSFPYALIRVRLIGNEYEVTMAKKKLSLYLGQMRAVEEVNRDVENELLFLVPSSAGHVEITCGDGCTKQVIFDLNRLQSNMLYFGVVRYIPAEEDYLNFLNMDSIKEQIYAEVEQQLQTNVESKNLVSGSATQSIDDGVEKHTYLVNGVSFTMVKVDGGSFIMGATKEQTSAERDEVPTHKVNLSDYYIAETEVTHALWSAVMDDSIEDARVEQYPKGGLSWEDCQRFIHKLRIITGLDFRMPTEAEWEYAARGGNRSKGFKYAGSDNLDEVAWHVDNSQNVSHPVAQKQPNELGLFDMSGSLYECCSDWYGAYLSREQTNPLGAAFGTHRVYRGGSRNCYYLKCRVAYRSNNIPLASYRDLGIRLALTK